MSKNLITKQGLEKFAKEKANLLITRKDAVLDLKKARELGDLSENGYYKSARLKLSQTDRRLRFLDRLLKTASIIETNDKQGIDIGDSVLLIHQNKKLSFTIVGSLESNPQNKFISYKSPLGKALLGKSKKQSVLVTTPSGKKEYTILEIKKNS